MSPDHPHGRRLDRRIARWLLPIIAMAIAAAAAETTHAQTIRRVPQDHPTIQQAIDACVSGDIVEVDAGTWTGGGLAVVQIVDLSVTIRNAPGTTPVIDGDLARHGLALLGTAASTLTLDGLEIARGNASLVSRDGGGLWINNPNAEVTLTNCLFTGNQADDRGGAVFLPAGATLDAIACEYHQNTAGDDGGAIAADGTTALIGCILDDNEAAIRGGAVSTDGLLTIENCGFGDDVAPVGPAIGQSKGSVVAIESSTFCGMGTTPIEGVWSDLGGNEILETCPIPPIVVAADGSGDFETIEAAVAAAESGGRIEIRAGTYGIAAGAPIDLGTKALTLVGDGLSTTIIEPAAGATVLLTTSGVSSPVPLRLQGLTFRNGGTGPTAGGVILQDRDVEIVQCRFTNHADLAVQARNCDLSIVVTGFDGNGLALGDGDDVDWPDSAPSNRGLEIFGGPIQSNAASLRLKVLGPVSIDAVLFESTGVGYIAGPQYSERDVDDPIQLDNTTFRGSSLTVGYLSYDHWSDVTVTDCRVSDGDFTVDHRGGTTTLERFEICGGDLRIDNFLASTTDVCVSATCDDANSNGVPDGCESVDDGIHRVPEEFATIQEAVAYAGWGDVVEVGPGEWVIGGDGDDGRPVIALPTGPITIRGTGTAADSTIRVSPGFGPDGPSRYPGLRGGLIGATFEHCTIVTACTDISSVISAGCPLTLSECTLRFQGALSQPYVSISAPDLTFTQCDIIAEESVIPDLRATVVHVLASTVDVTKTSQDFYGLIYAKQFECIGSTCVGGPLARVSPGDDSLPILMTVDQSNFSGGTDLGSMIRVNLGRCQGDSTSQVVVRDSTFEDLRASYDGAAIAINAYDYGCSGPQEITGTVLIERCDFLDCVSDDEGGAIEIDLDYPGISVTIDDCDFTGCSADEGGGAIEVEDGIGTIEVLNSRFRANVAGFYGGAIEADQPITIRGSLFENNVAIAEGGAVDLSGPSGSVIENSTFRENYALLAGGAIAAGQTGLTLTGGTLTGNTAQYGGGVWTLDTTFTATGTSFVENVGYLRGGAIECLGSTATLSNLDVRNNRSSQGAGGVQAIARSTVSAADSIFCDNEGRFPEVNHYETDGSSTWTDLGGNTEADNCLGGCPTDLNGDTQTDGADLGILFVQWGPCPPEGCAADFNQDGTVDGADLGSLFVGWGPCS